MTSSLIKNIIIYVYVGWCVWEHSSGSFGVSNAGGLYIGSGRLQYNWYRYQWKNHQWKKYHCTRYEKKTNETIISKWDRGS